MSENNNYLKTDGTITNLDIIPTFIDELEKALKAHDWTYAYSDDHRVWKRGQAERERIDELLSLAHRRGFTMMAARLYKKYKPDYC
tara:strand:- start:12668 stop:12925 length:258 start_codon:yes stop_codon:yes gene_type:complete